MMLSFFLATTALACTDPMNKPLANPYEALRNLEVGNPSFTACLDKLSRQGVDLHHVGAWRKERRPGSVSPVAYTITVQGTSLEGRPAILEIPYDLTLHAYRCGEPTHDVSRCY